MYLIRDILNEYQCPIANAALNISYKHPGIDYVVFGVDCLEQLQENIRVTKAEFSFQKCLEQLRISFLDIEKEVIFPSLWAKNK